MTSARLNKVETSKEFDFTSRDFERVRALIYQRAGIALAESKQEMVYSWRAGCAQPASGRSRRIWIRLSADSRTRNGRRSPMR